MNCICLVKKGKTVGECMNNTAGGYNSEELHVCRDCMKQMSKGLGCCLCPIGKQNIKGKSHEKVKKMIEQWNDEIRNYKSCSDRMDELWDALIAFLNNYSKI